MPPNLPGPSPLAAPNVICPTCGNLCEAQLKQFGKAMVTEVEYFCANPEKNCNWKVRATLSHINAENYTSMKPEDLAKLREEMEVRRAFQETRDNAVRELIALLPALKDVVHVHRQMSRPAPRLQPDTNETVRTTKPEPKTVTAPVLTSSGASDAVDAKAGEV